LEAGVLAALGLLAEGVSGVVGVWRMAYTDEELSEI
jgi:hypothetical protein